MAIIFSFICANNVYGATEKPKAEKGFKSEEDLLDETKTAIDNFLKEPGQGKSTPRQMKEKPAHFFKKEESVQQKPVMKKDEPAVNEPAVIKEKPTPSDKQPTQSVQNEPFDESQIKQDKAEEIDLVAKKDVVVIKPAIEAPILKKMEVEKIGASPYYETYEGFRFLKYFSAGQRVEIYQEARPIDSYILDAFSMRYITQPSGSPWDQKSDYRTHITPIFTRAYGTEFTMSDPKDKSGQIRYTHDYRDIYRNYYPKFPSIKKEMWDQNQILIMHSKQIEPIGWNYTSNIGYRYSTMNSKDPNYFEVRHTYFASLSLAPNERLEWFGQGEYYKSMHLRASYDYRPDHFLGRTELRIKSKDMKTIYVPSFSYSKDLYYPFADSYEKYEIQFRVGRDFSKRFSATSTVQFVYAFRDEPDNRYPSFIGKNPHKDKAEAISLKNRFSYNIYDRLYLQAGIDIENGINWSIFDNWAMMGGIEYYAPGMIRVNVGWTGNHYYNIQDFLSCVYFKFYLFM